MDKQKFCVSNQITLTLVVSFSSSFSPSKSNSSPIREMVIPENYLQTTTTLKCTYLLVLLSRFCMYFLAFKRSSNFLFLSLLSPEILSLLLFFPFSVITSSSIYFFIFSFYADNCVFPLFLYSFSTKV